MAGNANSGNRQGGKTLTEKFQRALNRALKQSEAGLNGQRDLSELLAELMQKDVATFMKVSSPFLPKEIIVDHSISIIAALDDAQSRIIAMRESVVASLPDGAHTNTLPLTIEGEASKLESE